MIDQKKLEQGAAAFSVPLCGEMLGAFSTYAEFLVEYNQKVNHTPITDPDGIVTRHFVDSLAPLGLVEFPEGASVVDVGTGAGFPSVPMAVARPDLRFTLLDSLQKRLTFLSQLAGKIDRQFALVHRRAEQAGADPALRERFDFAVSRAVAGLPALCEYCLPLVRVGGAMVALKGPDCGEEVRAAAHAVEVLGGGGVREIAYRLADGSGRTLVVIEKRSRTPPKYPRQRVKLTENPL